MPDDRQPGRLLGAGGGQRARLRGRSRSTDEGEDVTFETSYGASGDQSRAVEAGPTPTYVHFSLEPDVTRWSTPGLVAEDWKDNETKGIVTTSVVVFVVREGNPEDIETWDDLVKPGVEIVTPNPAPPARRSGTSSPPGRTSSSNGGTDEEAEEYTTKFFDNTVALPGSGRDATTAFTGGNGDVLLSYENEAILARQSGEDFDYVVPDDTLLIENPGAVTEDAAEPPQAFLDFLTSDEGQAAVRPDRLPPARRRRRPRRRSRAPTTRPTRSRRRRRCSPSTGLRWLGRGQRQVLRRGGRHRHGAIVAAGHSARMTSTRRRTWSGRRARLAGRPRAPP